MNRDETLTRGAETPPQLHENPRWLAPHDTDKGGTWIGANEHGVVACLLNAYKPGESLLPDPSTHYRTRGEIIPMLLEQGSTDAGLAWLASAFDPTPYPSFTLSLTSPSASRIYTWYKDDGLTEEKLSDQWTIRSSSGWDSADVIHWREQRFAQWLAEGGKMRDTLPEFHVLREPGKEDFSPLMKRDWSATRSITQVEVDVHAANICMRYWPQPAPESHEPEFTRSIGLARIFLNPA